MVYLYPCYGYSLYMSVVIVYICPCYGYSLYMSLLWFTYVLVVVYSLVLVIIESWDYFLHNIIKLL